MLVLTDPAQTFKSWKRNILTFLSLKAAYLIPQLVVRESGVWLDENAKTYAYALLMHATNDNNRDAHVVKCVSVARPDCATAAWDILRESLDDRSIARSLALLDNLMLRRRPGQ
jgi:spore cortex formation protein SpoVR/YcgB (stage V sporulation)